MEIKEWSNGHFGNIHDKITKNDLKLKYVEERLLDNPNSFQFNSWMECLLKQRTKLMFFNQKYWGKFSRKNCLQNGDKNTKFFQRTSTARRKCNKLIKIKDDCRIWIEEQNIIVDKFIVDYKQRFKSSHNNNKNLPKLGLNKIIFEDDNLELTRIPNIDKIKQVLFSIDSNKIPGPDRLGARSFKQYWHVIKHDLPIAL